MKKEEFVEMVRIALQEATDKAIEEHRKAGLGHLIDEMNKPDNTVPAGTR